jgi:signal transduction histidine kinase
VLITESPTDKRIQAAADLVLPPIPDFLEGQLQTPLRIRTENITLHQHEEDVNLLKDAVVNIVAHELNTPMLQVKGAVALLHDEINDTRTAMATQAIARLEASIVNITSLSSDLKFNPAPMSAREAIEAAIRSIRRSWKHRDQVHRIHKILPDCLPLVWGDIKSISTVVQLLLDNALKFSQDKVEVCAAIAKDQLERIFDAFYQGDSSTTRKYDGVGLGLTIVRRILDRHGVRVVVESRKGEGSTFSFILPIYTYIPEAHPLDVTG